MVGPADILNAGILVVDDTPLIREHLRVILEMDGYDVETAAELARRSDMQCAVIGPFLRELCNTLFDDPRMQQAFTTWGTRKETA